MFMYHRFHMHWYDIQFSKDTKKVLGEHNLRPRTHQPYNLKNIVCESTHSIVQTAFSMRRGKTKPLSLWWVWLLIPLQLLKCLVHKLYLAFNFGWFLSGFLQSCVQYTKLLVNKFYGFLQGQFYMESQPDVDINTWCVRSVEEIYIKNIIILVVVGENNTCTVYNDSIKQESWLQPKHTRGR